MKFLVLVALILILPMILHGQEVHQEMKETVRAEVLEVVHEEWQDIIGTDTEALVQEVRVEILEGERKGSEAMFLNDLMEVEVGDSIYVNRLVSIDGVEYYTFKDADRSFALISVVVVFIGVLVFFSGRHGLRAILSLILSTTILFVFLVPMLLKGYPPVIVSVLVAGPMLASALFLTHGVHARSVIAFLGTFTTVVVTGILATLWVKISHFTGLSSDEAIYLNFSTHGALDFGGILLGSIIIGILGILDDVAITQASVVAELKRANHTLGLRELYTRALRVGRDHIGSLVNTLSFAYVGVSLPLILLLVKAESSLVLSLNQEMVAVELIRIFVGSIGLILAVPVTTAIAAWWYDRYKEEGVHAPSHGHGHYH